MRLVDADAFKAEGRDLYREAKWDLREIHYSQLDMECNIDMMPTIAAVPLESYRSMEQTVHKLAQALAEAKPIKHGRWIYDEHNGNYYCSECHRRGGVYIDGNNGIELFGNYCGICGAKMDGTNKSVESVDLGNGFSISVNKSQSDTQGRYCIECLYSPTCYGAGIDKPACKAFVPKVRYVDSKEGGEND